MELLLGCGRSRTKYLVLADRPAAWEDLTTLDHEATHSPDVVHDLNNPVLPFASDLFDEIHAYEVLEHLGTQGDWRFFFKQFSEFWRVLRPGGIMCGTVPLPTSIWAWGDPSHTRVLPRTAFMFLAQRFYDQVGKTNCSDFRSCYHADFDVFYLKDAGESLQFGLRAVKT